MNKVKISYILTGAVIASFLLLATALLFIRNNDINGKRKAVNTIIFIDNIAPFSDEVADEIKRRTNDFIGKNCRKNDLVTIYTLDPSNSTKLSRTSTIEVQSQGDAPRLLMMMRDIMPIRTESPIYAAVKEALSKAAAVPDTSPTAQAIIDISQDVEHLAPDTSRNLLIFSCLMENTPAFSLSSCNDTLDACVEDYKRSRDGLMERPEFINTKIYLNVIPLTLEKKVSENKDKFWQWYFSKTNGSSKLKYDYLPQGKRRIKRS